MSLKCIANSNLRFDPKAARLRRDDMARRAARQRRSLIQTARKAQLCQGVLRIRTHAFDAYIVISKAHAYFGGGNRKVEGIGLIRYRTILESFDLLHALYEIRVVDGKTFDIIEKLAAGPLDDASGIRLPGPSLLIDTGFDEQNENLHRAVVDLVIRSLPSTLSDMHLINRKQ